MIVRAEKTQHRPAQVAQQLGDAGSRLGAAAALYRLRGAGCRFRGDRRATLRIKRGRVGYPPGPRRLG